MSTTKAPRVAIERHFDAEALNRTVNDPSVYPWVRGGATGRLDLGVVATNPANLLLVGEHGSMLFTPMAPGLWELHTQVVRAGRGAWAVGLATACLEWLFTRTDAVEVLTRVPKGNVAALAGARILGMQHAWTAERGWVLRDVPVPAGIWSLPVQAWLAGPFAEALDSDAQRFVDVASAGSDRDTLADAIRPLGFLLACVRGRQVAKGCVMLNRWAAIAGFAPAFVADAEPLVLNVGGVPLRFSDDGRPLGPVTVH